MLGHILKLFYKTEFNGNLKHVGLAEEKLINYYKERRENVWVTKMSDKVIWANNSNTLFKLPSLFIILC